VEGKRKKYIMMNQVTGSPMHGSAHVEPDMDEGVGKGEDGEVEVVELEREPLIEVESLSFTAPQIDGEQGVFSPSAIDEEGGNFAQVVGENLQSAENSQVDEMDFFFPHIIDDDGDNDDAMFNNLLEFLS
jgi:hypothetical protein